MVEQELKAAEPAQKCTAWTAVWKQILMITKTRLNTGRKTYVKLLLKILRHMNLITPTKNKIVTKTGIYNYTEFYKSLPNSYKTRIRF